MNWKTRQMFSDREHGIVSGLSPINMTGGGNVPYPSYENGGDVLPQLPNNYHTHPELHSHGSQRPHGSPLGPEDYIRFNGGGTVPYPSYQNGTSPEEAETLDMMDMIRRRGEYAQTPNEQKQSMLEALSYASVLLPYPTIGKLVAAQAALRAVKKLGEVSKPVIKKLEDAIEKADNILYGTAITGSVGAGTAIKGGVLEGDTMDEEAEALDAMQAATMGGAPVSPAEPSIEQQVADLAAKMGISVPEARAMLLRQMIQAKGVTLSDEVINQFATGLITLQDALAQAMGPPKMQAGTGPGEAMAIDLFQQGDEDINQALNMMSGSVSPNIADIGPTAPTETIEETVTVTEDQGPTDTEAAKAPFQQMAVEVVKEATMSLAREDYMNIEKVQQEVEQQLTAIDETYRQQTGATDTILTEEFLAQLDNLMTSAGDEFDAIPGMVEGTDKETAVAYDINTLITSMAGTGADPVKIKEIIEKYYPGGPGMSEEKLQERIKTARRSALLGGKTKQKGLTGMMDILSQADAAEVAAIGSMPETLSQQEGRIKELALAGELETAGGVGAGGVTADAKKMLMMQAIMNDPNMPQDMKDIFLKGLAGIKPGKEQKIDLIKSFMKDLLSKSPSDRKKIVGTKNPPTQQEIAQWAAGMADTILSSLSGEKKER